jgi:hypothetical protein
MDFFDLIPIVPPGLPGENSPERTPGHRLAAGVASTVLPAINFALVLFAGFASHAMIALVVMPLVSAGLVVVLSRRLSVSIAWAIVLGMGCAAFCFIGNASALFLHALAQFYRDF